jgi:hypothetical protein
MSMSLMLSRCGPRDTPLALRHPERSPLGYFRGLPGRENDPWRQGPHIWWLSSATDMDDGNTAVAGPPSNGSR